MSDTHARTTELLGSEEYGAAFTKAMSGNDTALTEHERSLLREAKELTGTDGPGYPMPSNLDSTRNNLG